MELFHVDKAVDQSFTFGDGSSTRLVLTPASAEQRKTGNIPATHIQCSTAACLVNINKCLNVELKLDVGIQAFSQQIKQRAVAMPNFPIVITNTDITEDDAINGRGGKLLNTPFIDVLERTKSLQDAGQRSVRLAIINGMGTGIGDSIIGVRALNILYTRLMTVFDSVHIDLFQTPFNTSYTKRSIYEQEKIVKSVQGLPVSLEQILTYDLLADFSSMVNRENFDNQSMMDFYLENLGIPKASISAEQRRVFVKRNEFIRDNNKFIFDTMRNGNKMLLVQPNASVAVRSMPTDAFKKIVNHAIESTDYTVLCIEQPKFSQEINMREFKLSLGKNSNRFFFIPELADGFDNFTNTIAEMDAIITVDTCSYHIADSFAIPTVVLFTTIEPGYRVEDYPHTVGISLKAKNNKLNGIHVTYAEDEIKLAHSYWDKANLNNIFKKLSELAIDRMLIHRVNCPVCNTLNADIATDRYLDYRIIPCVGCETEFSLPRRAADYNKLYASKGDDYSYQQYVAEGERPIVINRYMTTLRFQDIKRFLALSPTKGTLLDVGCANGFLPAYADDHGYIGYGIDSSDQAIKFAEEHMNLKGRVAVCSDLSNLPDNLPATYDVITSFELVEHLEDPVAFAKSVYERLAPGGVWIFSTPNRNRIQFKMGVKNTGRHRGHDTGDYPSEHLSRFTDKSHKILAEIGGFEVFFQNTSTLSAASVMDHQGNFPNFSLKNQDGSITPIDGVAVGNTAFGYFQHMCSSITNHGNFLITFARKPLDK